MGRGVVEVQSNEVGGGLVAGSAGSRWTTVRFEAWRDHVTSRPFSARLRCCDWRCSNSADATGDGRNVQNKALKQNLHPFKPSKNRSKETKNKQKKSPYIGQVPEIQQHAIEQRKPGFTEFYSVSLSFTEFYQVIPDFTKFYQILPSFTKFYRVSSIFMEFYRVLPTFTGFYRVIPDFT